MISIKIPERKILNAEYLVLDFNGTLAIDGKLIEGTRELLKLLSKHLSIHVLTADTFHSSQQELAGIDCTLKILTSANQDIRKESYIRDLEPGKVIAIGNGLNDALMLKTAALGIAVIQKEGASIQSLLNADIVCPNITDALELLQFPQRIVATLRK